MKIKKTLAALLAGVCAISMGALVACGGGNTGDNGGDKDQDNNPPGITTYTFEAEGVDLSEQSGRGWSNEAAGCQMIQGQNTKAIRDNSTVIKSVSNGYFVGFFGTEGTELVFDITADEADSEATLVLRLASEWGTLTIDNTVMTVEVNGVNVEFDAFDVTGKKIDSASAVEYGVPFKDFTLSTKIALNKGDNTIKLIAQGKKHPDADSLRMGPGVDCIKIKSAAKLSWESLWDENKDNVKSET